MISAADLQAALQSVDPSWADAARAEDFPKPARVTAGQFALIASRILLQQDDQ
jgi:hypothetical protein